MSGQAAVAHADERAQNAAAAERRLEVAQQELRRREARLADSQVGRKGFAGDCWEALA